MAPRPGNSHSGDIDAAAAADEDAAIINAFRRANCNRVTAVADFHRLREAEPTLARSNIGSCAVDYGTFDQRFRARRRGKTGSPLDFCRNPSNWSAVNALAVASGRPLSDYAGLYCGLVASFRPMTAKWLISHFRASRVLDPFAGWGGRLLGAMASDVHYVGIERNTDLRRGHGRLLGLLGPHSRSDVRMIYRPAETVDFAELPPYDAIVTSLADDADDGSAPIRVLLRAFYSMNNHGWMCINAPSETVGDRCIAMFGPPTETHRRALVGFRPTNAHTERSETIYCWHKRPMQR